MFCFECNKTKDFETATELREHYFGNHPELVPLAWKAPSERIKQYRQVIENRLSQFIVS